MTCAEAARYFQDYLDRELTPEDLRGLEDHLEQCGSCFGHLAFDRALKRLVKKKNLYPRLSRRIKELLRKKLYG